MFRKIQATYFLLAHGAGPIKAFRFADVIVQSADQTLKEWTEQTHWRNSSYGDANRLYWRDACSFAAWDWCREAHENGDL